MIRSLFVALIACSICPTLWGQWRGPLLERFGPDDGLTGDVRDIAQDSLGYIYLASGQGLYQYDGSTFKLHAHDPDDPFSISSGHVFSVIAGRDSLVWLALYENGINRFDPRTGKFTRYPLPDHGLSDLTGAISLTEDIDGDIWAGSYHYRLYQLDRPADTFKVFVPPWADPATLLDSRKDLVCLLVDRNDPDILWLTVLDEPAPETEFRGSGIFSFHRKSHVFEWARCNGRLRYQDRSGRLWGTFWEAAISRYDPTLHSCQIIKYPQMFGKDKVTEAPRVRDVIDVGGQILLTTQGLLTIDEEDRLRWKIREEKQVDYTALLADRMSNVWLGTDDGLHVMSPIDQQIRFFSLAQFGVEDRQYPARIAFDASEEMIYLPEISPHKEHMIYTIPLSEDDPRPAAAVATGFYPTGVAFDNSGILWAAGAGSIHRKNPGGTFAPVNIPEMMPRQIPWLWHLRTHSDGWIGGVGQRGFYWFHPDSLRMHHLPMGEFANRSRWVANGFSYGKRRNAHVFVEGVVVEVDLATGNTQALNWPDELVDEMDLIQYAQEVNDSVFWVAIYSTLFKFFKDGSNLQLLDEFTVKDGLISPTISELHFDDSGRVWVFSHSGINAINPETREIRHFGTKEGLPVALTDPRQVITVSEGKIATVCGNGVIVFDPDQLWNSVSRPDVPVMIQEVRVDGIAITADTSRKDPVRYMLPGGARVIDAKFQALAYPTDRHVTYSYRINNTGDQWIDIGKNNFVTLPDLPFGTTHFQVKAGSGHSAALHTEILFVLPTPLYAHWWFAPLLILLGLAGLFYLYRRRVRRIQRRAEEQTLINKKIAELELTALRSQMNPHFMFNSLNSIKTYILEAKPDVAADYLSQFAHLIRRILQNSSEKMISLKEEIEALLLYVSLEQFRFENAFEFVYDVDQSLQLEEVYIPPMLLQPFVENAIWHGLMHKKTGGVLHLRFTRENGYLNCVIEDNGVGRKRAAELKSLSATRHKSMGLGITRHRMHLLNNAETMGLTIEIIDKMNQHAEPSGTKVVVRIPLTRAEEI